MTMTVEKEMEEKDWEETGREEKEGEEEEDDTRWVNEEEDMQEGW